VGDHEDLAEPPPQALQSQQHACPAFFVEGPENLIEHEQADGASDLGLDDAALTVSPVDGRRIVEIDTDSPTPLLHRLTSWAVSHEIELEGLEVARPSLEDVYLTLTAEDNT